MTKFLHMPVLHAYIMPYIVGSWLNRVGGIYYLLGCNASCVLIQSRNCSLTGSSISLQCRLLVLPALCIISASHIFLFQYDGSTDTILASSQLTLWSSSHACVAIPFFLSPVLTAPLCSITLCLKFYLFSLCTLSHSLDRVFGTPHFYSISLVWVFLHVSAFHVMCDGT